MSLSLGEGATTFLMTSKRRFTQKNLPDDVKEENYSEILKTKSCATMSKASQAFSNSIALKRDEEEEDRPVTILRAKEQVVKVDSKPI